MAQTIEAPAGLQKTLETDNPPSGGYFFALSELFYNEHRELFAKPYGMVALGRFDKAVATVVLANQSPDAYLWQLVLNGPARPDEEPVFARHGSADRVVLGLEIGRGDTLSGWQADYDMYMKELGDKLLGPDELSTLWNAITEVVDSQRTTINRQHLNLEQARADDEVDEILREKPRSIGFVALRLELRPAS